MKPLMILAGTLAAISLASFVFWANPSAPVAPPTPTPASVTILEPDKYHGTVKLNESILDTFTIVNPTDRAISFNEPMKSCTCTAAELDRRELGPGESGKLTVSIQTGTRRVPRVETVGLLYKSRANRRCTSCLRKCTSSRKACSKPTRPTSP